MILEDQQSGFGFRFRDGGEHRFCSCDRVIPLVILIMNAAKVAISIDQRMLRHLDRLVKSRVFRSRSEAIQKAVEEKLVRLEKSRLERECAKLSRREEQAFADLGLEADAKEWPPY